MEMLPLRLFEGSNVQVNHLVGLKTVTQRLEVGAEKKGLHLLYFNRTKRVITVAEWVKKGI
ncbi:hypothetical protein ASG89_18195 [Paenibacillus sp. Soil766]|nr:hypothetical protein ASG89_18195 [Paenibacillus sp. Soil766]